MEKILREMGCGFIRTHAIEDEEDPGAPSLYIGEWKIALPDLDVVKDGKRFWIEVKAKTRPVFYRKTGQYRHGFELSRWNSYKRIEQEMGSPVFIVVHEQDMDNLLVQSVKKLKTVAIPGEGRQKSFVYFPRSSFFQWAKKGESSGKYEFTNRFWILEELIKK